MKSFVVLLGIVIVGVVFIVYGIPKIIEYKNAQYIKWLRQQPPEVQASIGGATKTVTTGKARF